MSNKYTLADIERAYHNLRMRYILSSSGGIGSGPNAEKFNDLRNQLLLDAEEQELKKTAAQLKPKDLIPECPQQPEGNQE